MDQLAKLGVAFTSDGAEALTKELKGIEATSKSAEAATEKLTDAVKKASPAAKEASSGYRLLAGAMNDNNAHVTEFIANQKRLAVANDNAAKSARVLSQAGLGLGRQFADVGVSLASGINPMMVLIQQGPQVADAFATAAASGVGFKAVLSGIYAQAAPLIATFAPWAAGLAAVGGAVWYVIDAEQKHAEAVKILGRSIEEQRKRLDERAPSLILNADSETLATEATRNFEAYLQRTNGTLERNIDLMRQAAILKYKGEVATAADNRQKAEKELAWQRSKPGISGSTNVGGFGTISAPAASSGKKSPDQIKAERELAIARENERRAKELLAQAQATPKSKAAEAFGGIIAPPPKAPSAGSGSSVPANPATETESWASLFEKVKMDASRVAAEEAAKAEQKAFNATIIKPFDGKDIKDPTVKTAQDAAAELQKIQDAQAKARIDSQRQMWDSLIGLSYSGNKKLAAIGRAAALVEATRAGYLAIQKAWASAPFPYNLPAVAVTTASTVANVANIAGVKGFASGGYTGNGPVGAEAGVVHGQEFVVNAAATRRNRATLEAMNAGRAIPKNPAAANSNSRTPPIMIVPSPLFDVVVSNQAASVARPIARQEATTAGEGAVSTSVDLDQRRSMMRLR